MWNVPFTVLGFNIRSHYSNLNEWQLKMNDSYAELWSSSVYKHTFFIFLPLVETVALLRRDVQGPSTQYDLPPWKLRWLCCVHSPSFRCVTSRLPVSYVLLALHLLLACRSTLLVALRSPQKGKPPSAGARAAGSDILKGCPRGASRLPIGRKRCQSKEGGDHAHRHCGARTTSGAGFEQNRFKAHYVHRIPVCQLTPSTFIPPGTDECHNSGNNMYSLLIWRWKKVLNFKLLFGMQRILILWPSVWKIEFLAYWLKALLYFFSILYPLLWSEPDFMYTRTLITSIGLTCSQLHRLLQSDKPSLFVFRLFSPPPPPPLSRPHFHLCATEAESRMDFAESVNRCQGAAFRLSRPGRIWDGTGKTRRHLSLQKPLS